MDSTCLFTVLGAVSFVAYRKFRFHKRNRTSATSLCPTLLPPSTCFLTLLGTVSFIAYRKFRFSKNNKRSATSLSPTLIPSSTYFFPSLRTVTFTTSLFPTLLPSSTCFFTLLGTVSFIAYRNFRFYKNYKRSPTSLSPTLFPISACFFTLLGTLSLMAYRKFRFHKSNQRTATSLSPTSIPSSSSPSPLPSSLSRSWGHQVFPSFRGEDVRRGFLSHVLKEFERKGITPFIDNAIDRSKSIGPELIEAIKRSRVAIVLLSRNYASSTWCLDELVEIMKCRKELGLIVMVIFYEVDPSDVKKQRGYFGTVFKKMCVGKTVEDIKRWKEALEEVAIIAGYDLSSGSWNNEADMIEKVATDVSHMLNDATSSSDFDKLVGMEAHIEQISSLLSVDSSDVRMVGIWGPAGIGKTTIARAVYSKLSNNFTHTAFMESIRGSHEKRYSDDIAFMLHLQEQLLSKTLNQKDLKIDHLGVAEERLKDKKVLVVLDDVHDIKQLKAMAYETRWFGCGSRIIITTKDKQLLQAHGINHSYHVDFPLSSQALEILCLSAFGQNSPNSGFEALAMEVTRLAGNLPLGLSVFGSYLRGMSRDEWIPALPRLRTSLDGNIEKVLMLSYKALCDKDKDLFLHIACLFNGESTKYLKWCLAESDLDVSHGLQVLVDKFLLSINKEESLVMHNLLEQLGREIVRKECKDEPGKRKFLVDAREICDVLADNTVSFHSLSLPCSENHVISNYMCSLDPQMLYVEPFQGSGAVVGIDLNLATIKEESSINERAFEEMSGLQFLTFYSRCTDSNDNNKLILPWGLNNLPRKLRVLHWHKSPLRFLPPTFRGEFLVIIEMHSSCLEKLWEVTPPLRCLKKIDLFCSLKFKEVPNLSNACNLEELILDSCESVVEIPSSSGNVTNLQALSGQHSSGLESFHDTTSAQEIHLSNTAIGEKPSSIMWCSHLHTLSMWKCHRLELFPDVPNSIEVLNLSETGIEEVPRWIQNLSRLEELRMVGCKKLKVLPTNINLESLSLLALSDCTQLKFFPDISTSIEYLYLENTGIEEVPPCIRSWPDLVTLSMRGCNNLKVFPAVLGRMEELDLSETGINLLDGDLEGIPDWGEQVHPLLKRLFLNGCKNLVSLPQLPDSLVFLDASNCELLEVIDGFFNNPQIALSFANCLKLNKEARELIQRSDSISYALPCGEVPSYFRHQSSGSCLTIPLIIYKAIPRVVRFNACILVAPYSSTSRRFRISWCIWDKCNGLLRQDVCSSTVDKLVTDHLLTFQASFSLEKGTDSEVMVTCRELLFVFQIVNEESEKKSGGWESVGYDSLKVTIMGCGVRILNVHGEDQEELRFCEYTDE